MKSLQIKNQLLLIRRFFIEDLWSVRLRDLPLLKRFLFKFLRIIIITFAEFKKDRVGEKASNLTYFTLLSIVPVIALAFGIAKGFGLKSVIDRQLEGVIGQFMTGLNGQEDSEAAMTQLEIQSKLGGIVDKMIDSANGGIVAGVGLAVLIYLVMRLLTNIEVTFNVMWDIKKHRPIHRKLADYISVMILGILLVILSSSATVYIHTVVDGLADSGEVGSIKSGVIFLIKLIPYSLIWLLLFLVYLIFPNTRVKILPALIGGIIAGSAYQITQWGFIRFGGFIFARYNDVYGGFAMLPLSLIYIQLSWYIVLIGAELAYAMQHYDNWVPDNEDIRLSQGHKKKLALIIMHRIISRFEEGQKAISVRQLASKGSVPYRFVMEICYELERARLISRLEGSKGEDVYQPAFDIQKMSIEKVLTKLDNDGKGYFDQVKSEEFVRLENSLEEMNELYKKSDANILLKDL